ncbi:DJ-1/PfpI family protein [Gloeothece verrucosa]|uniref:ThiJ/PfpI domain protein n=1 Tax=Gloeothece verrucosa (strain PCC 7822) TaxID=497965 RepID=E0U561_GLOV7|nr:DJ-1/PfpI family protein [Gloeothece verrucosa]ADN12340.1 ThiJ/PfpI domain protein [Gloeothece verrucosa PCC 7822]
MNQDIKHRIGLVIFPGMTQLDINGPLTVLHRTPNSQIYILWKNLDPVTSDEGLKILPNQTFAECPPLDVVCVPGGPGHLEMIKDKEMLEFLQKQSQQAKYVTSVCTGALILGAAGLLQGYRATCHWAFLEQLGYLGAQVCRERVVIDRDRITGGGVTAGIDFGLILVKVLCGEQTAKFIELLLEYNPDPPFGVGSPEKAGKELVALVQQMGKEYIETSRQEIQQIAKKLNPTSV